MTILAFDPGSITTGWAILSTNPTQYQASGTIALGQGPWMGRILTLTGAVRAILDSWNPTDLVLEKAFIGLNKDSALKLAQIRGALMGLCAHPDLSLTEYAPREVKAQVTGYGGASKEQLGHMIRRLYPQLGELSSWDESDALALATCHALRQRPTYPSRRTPCSRA